MLFRSVRIPRWRRIPWCCAVPYSATNNLPKRFLLLLVRLNLGFILRENLLLNSSYLPLGVPNERVSFTSSSQFPVFCCFSIQKIYTGNILEIARDKNPVSYFPNTYTESKGEKEGSPEASTPPGGAAPPLGAPGSCVGPTGALDHSTSTYLYPLT